MSTVSLLAVRGKQSTCDQRHTYNTKANQVRRKTKEKKMMMEDSWKH